MNISSKFVEGFESQRKNKRERERTLSAVVTWYVIQIYHMIWFISYLRSYTCMRDYFIYVLIIRKMLWNESFGSSMGKLLQNKILKFPSMASKTEWTLCTVMRFDVCICIRVHAPTLNVIEFYAHWKCAKICSFEFEWNWILDYSPSKSQTKAKMLNRLLLIRFV